jgi:hypothetical protein
METGRNTLLHPSGENVDHSQEWVIGRGDGWFLKTGF